MVNEIFSVFSCRVSLLLLANVVVALTEGSLPVLFVKIGVVFFVERAGTWRRVSILDSIRNVVVVMALDTDGHLESLKPIFSCLSSLDEEFIYHLSSCFLIIILLITNYLVLSL